jgi:hypothetical protein
VLDYAQYLINGKRDTKEEILERLNHPLSIGRRIRKTCVSYLAMSCGAGFATAPVSVALFGYVSGWTLLCNVLFVPLIVAAFSAVLFCVFVCCVLPIAIAPILLYPANVFWSALLLVFQTADFSSFVLEGWQVGYSALACYYMAMAFCSDKLQIKKRAKLCLAVVFLAAFAVCVIAAA